jgi:hypothetical protein
MDEETELRLLALKSLNTKKEFLGLPTHRIKVVDGHAYNEKYYTSQPFASQSESTRWLHTSKYPAYASRSTAANVEENCRVIPTNVQLSPRSYSFVKTNTDALLRRKIDKSPSYRYRSPSPNYVTERSWSKSPSPIHDLNNKRHKRSKSNTPGTNRTKLSNTPPSSVNPSRHLSRSPTYYHRHKHRSRSPLSLSPNSRSDKKNVFKREISPHRRKLKSSVPRSLSPKQENRKQMSQNNYKSNTRPPIDAKLSRSSPSARKPHEDHSKKRRYRSRDDDLYKNDKSKHKDQRNRDGSQSSRIRPETSKYSVQPSNKSTLPKIKDSNGVEPVASNFNSSLVASEQKIEAVSVHTKVTHENPSTDSVDVEAEPEKSSDVEDGEDEDEFEIDLFPSDESESENEGRFKLNAHKSNENPASKQILSFRSLLVETATSGSTTKSTVVGQLASEASKPTSSRQDSDSVRHQYKDVHVKKKEGE